MHTKRPIHPSVGFGGTPDRLRRARALLEAKTEIQEVDAAAVPTLSGVDLALRPGLHEWFAPEVGSVWIPPLAVLIDLAHRALIAFPGRPGGRAVVWIGRRCWPFPHALVCRDPAGGAGDRRLLTRSVFVDPPGRAERVWAMDLALRSPGVAAVVADGAGLAMPESRRLQLAAGGAVGLLARPDRERRELSAARTRWAVAPSRAHGAGQVWTVELLRCKGAQPTDGGVRRWAVRRDHATGAMDEWTACDVDLAPDVADRPAQAARARIA
jgi:hypothetical protein